MSSNFDKNSNFYYNKNYDSDSTTVTESSSSQSYSNLYDPYDNDNDSIFSKLSNLTDLSYENYDDYSVSSSPRYTNNFRRIYVNDNNQNQNQNQNQNPLNSIEEYNTTETETETDSVSDIDSEIYTDNRIEEMLGEYNYNTIWNIYNTGKYKTILNKINLNVLSLFSRLLLFIMNPTYIFHDCYETNYKNLKYKIDDTTKLILLNEEYTNFKKFKVILLFYSLKIPTYFVISNIHFDRFYTPLLKYLGFISDTSNVSISEELSTLLYDINYNKEKKINVLIMSNYENLQVNKVFNIAQNIKSGIINIYYDENQHTNMISYEYNEDKTVLNDIEFYNNINSENIENTERKFLINSLRFVVGLSKIIVIITKYTLLLIMIFTVFNMFNIIERNYIHDITYYTLNIIRNIANKLHESSNIQIGYDFF